MCLHLQSLKNFYANKKKIHDNFFKFIKQNNIVLFTRYDKTYVYSNDIIYFGVQ